MEILWKICAVALFRRLGVFAAFVAIYPQMVAKRLATPPPAPRSRLPIFVSERCRYSDYQIAATDEPAHRLHWAILGAATPDGGGRYVSNTTGAQPPNARFESTLRKQPPQNPPIVAAASPSCRCHFVSLLRVGGAATSDGGGGGGAQCRALLAGSDGQPWCFLLYQ